MNGVAGRIGVLEDQRSLKTSWNSRKEKSSNGFLQVSYKARADLRTIFMGISLVQAVMVPIFTCNSKQRSMNCGWYKPTSQKYQTSFVFNNGGRFFVEMEVTWKSFEFVSLAPDRYIQIGAQTGAVTAVFCPNNGVARDSSGVPSCRRIRPEARYQCVPNHLLPSLPAEKTRSNQHEIKQQHYNQILNYICDI